MRQFKEVVVNWRVIEDLQPVCQGFQIPYKLKSILQRDVWREKEVYAREGTYISPLSSTPISNLDELSSCLLLEHQKKSSDGLVVRQRHSIRRMNVVKVRGEYKKDYTYYVYGTDNCVYLPEYPNLFGF